MKTPNYAPSRNTLPIIRNTLAVIMGLAAALFGSFQAGHAQTLELPKDVTRVPVVFSGGHETEGVDRGRPVMLIAAALGVAPDVFREAFSHVHPAGPGSGGPTDAEARQNKAALMNALGKFGVTDEKLNEVSDYYRYPPGRGGVWKNKPAAANALVKNGAVISYEITEGGSGYTSPPTVSVPDVKAAPAKVELSFGKVMEKNGAVSAITPAQNSAS